MRYSIPTNWQDNLIDGLIDCQGSELYGKLNNDIIGGGRASAILPQVSLKKAERHILSAHQKGLKFNYLLNGTCLGDMQYLQSQKNNILKMLDWLVSAEVDSVTISSAYLYRLIRERAPRLNIYVSVQDSVNNELQIRRWDEIGVDKITLSVLDANRDFKLLRRIKGRIKCDLQLIANLKCLLGCPAYHCHSNLNAHSSQSQHILKGYLIDYYTLKCNYIRLNDPVELIKSLWIRPEDVHYYEETGINWLKLVGREMDSAKIHLIFNAYRKRRYDGNLLDLLPNTKKRLFSYKKIKTIFKYFLRPEHINPFILLQARNVFKEEGVYIDNRGLDGFLDYFWEEKCNFMCGRQCSYCHKIAGQVMTIDHKHLDKRIKNSKVFLENLISGRLFDYF